MAAPVPVTLTVQLLPKAFANLQEQAKAKGYTANKYTQLLFDAAFAARIGQVRGAPATDAELDEQVRLVFACCGEAEPAAIAKATGLPIERVELVLDGLKQAAKAKGKRR
ncbi:hypothetical protein [Tianweitania sediminis]|uniref:Uncharacterized protein n=1 Tax=Tianweitania sediminis TaxID=1502156 RepID=A0A8J7R348_9HYPH|nr:hypothetical protein [Tianweitania sediminis]MBP0439606.1 hypothetical protein [Tianweitania sediminis]